MLALLFDTHLRLVHDHPLPRRRAGEALIRPLLAGLCDTDLGLLRGYLGFRGVLGHEFVGQVTEADDPRWVGRRVVGDINAGCGHCADCESGDGHHCPARTVLGIAGRDGVLAECFTLPERCLVEVPPSLSDECAVFAEPLAAAAHVLDVAGDVRDVTTLVLGDGKLGLLVALVLAHAGARVTLVGHHRDHLALVEGANIRICLESELSDAPQRASLVVEATGQSSGLERAVALAIPRGRVVMKTTISARYGIDWARVVVDEITLIGSRCGDLKVSVDLLASGAVDPRPLIAATYLLAEADRALEHAGRPGTLKVVVQGP